MVSRSVLCRAVFLFFVTLFPVCACAAVNISIASSDGSTYVMQATGLTNVGGLDITVRYDTSILNNPQVAKGTVLSSAVSAINTANGTIRIGAVSTSALPSSGAVATFTFTRTGDAPGGITGISATGYDTGKSSARIALTSSYSNPQPAATASSTSTSTATGTTDSTTGGTGGFGTTGSGNVLAGTITLPSDPLAASDRRDQKAEAPPQQGADQPVQQPEDQPGEGAEVAPQPAPQPEERAPQKQGEREAVQSVLERFRLYQGERTPQTLTALFDKAGSAGCRQDPPIAVSDGEGIVSVTITGVAGDRAPNFAFQGARFVTMKNAGDGTWLVQAKPNKDAVISTVSIFAGGEVQEIPLTVAPKARVDLVVPGRVTPADFDLFLKERGTAEAPKHDLNGDGKRDYLDDYIFTANYLVAQRGKGAEGVKAAPEQKGAPEPRQAPGAKPAGK